MFIVSCSPSMSVFNDGGGAQPDPPTHSADPQTHQPLNTWSEAVPLGTGPKPLKNTSATSRTAAICSSVGTKRGSTSKQMHLVFNCLCNFKANGRFECHRPHLYLFLTIGGGSLSTLKKKTGFVLGKIRFLALQVYCRHTKTPF